MYIDVNNIDFDIKFTGKDEMPGTVKIKIGQLELSGFSLRRSKFDSGLPLVLFPPTAKTRSGNYMKLFFAPTEDWKRMNEIINKQFINERPKNNDTGNNQNANFLFSEDKSDLEHIPF